mmetsp:Transcript_36214/g.79256  ORF Transcript_36214/g.79256 Transcript_36214/m.79256 type:complete len:127 (-) Transcript_36214:788-1168(-)
MRVSAASFIFVSAVIVPLSRSFSTKPTSRQSPTNRQFHLMYSSSEISCDDTSSVRDAVPNASSRRTLLTKAAGVILTSSAVVTGGITRELHLRPTLRSDLSTSLPIQMRFYRASPSMLRISLRNRQ